MGGRPRKPDQVKALQGTLKKCRALDDSSELSALEPLSGITPPKWLGKKAKMIFKEKANQLMSIRVLTVVDIDLLAMYANSYALMVEAYRQMHPNATALAVSIENPFKVYAEQAKIVNQIGAQFGFSPSSRSSIMAAVAAGKPKKKDDFEEFE